jgi:hypothetical protein
MDFVSAPFEAAAHPQVLRGLLSDLTQRAINLMIVRPQRNERMKRTWTIIGVADVFHSLNWYQSLLGLLETAPAHDDFGQIVDSDGTVLLCLHK